MKKNNNLLIGAHVSTSGGLANACLRAHELETDCFQIFVKNNRQWQAKKLSEIDIFEFKASIKKYAIKYPIAHATYLINLCSQDGQVRDKSYKCLEYELLSCNMLDIPYLVLHPCSTDQDYIIYISDAINRIYETNNIKTELLLETMAGQGNSIGHKFENLRDIYDKINLKNKIGFCFDTCHVFAAGYDISTNEKFNNTINKFDQVLGLENLKVFHLNNSKKDCNSKIDRHEHLGLGKIGIELFQIIMSDKRFKNIPKIIETPKESEFDDINNLNVLRNS